MTLRRTGPIERKTPLRRAPFNPGQRPKAKRKPVSPEERRARDLVYARSGWICEGCRQAPAAEWAHRVSRAQGGPWCAANGLHLCNDLTARPGKRGCHEWSHGKDRAEAEALGWILRTHHDYLTTPVWLAGRGLTYLTTDGDYVPAERNDAA